MEYEYKNITNMTKEEHENFMKDPHKWMQNQIKEALQYDSIVAKCYMAFVSLYNVEDPFEDTKFLTFLAFHALLSNSINFKRLVEIVEMQTSPPPYLIPKGNTIIDSNN